MYFAPMPVATETEEIAKITQILSHRFSLKWKSRHVESLSANRLVSGDVEVVTLIAFNTKNLPFQS